MPSTTRPDPDTILAHVRVLRLTDRLLDVAEELREARDTLQTLTSSAPTHNCPPTENANAEGRPDA